MADKVNPGVAEAENFEQPTPTQAENDAAKLGGRDPKEVEAEQAKADAEKPKADAKASREAKADNGAKYETR